MVRGDGGGHVECANGEDGEEGAKEGGDGCGDVAGGSIWVSTVAEEVGEGEGEAVGEVREGETVKESVEGEVPGRRRGEGGGHGLVGLIVLGKRAGKLRMVAWECRMSCLMQTLYVLVKNDRSRFEHLTLPDLPSNETSKSSESIDKLFQQCLSGASIPHSEPSSGGGRLSDGQIINASYQRKHLKSKTPCLQSLSVTLQDSSAKRIKTQKRRRK